MTKDKTDYFDALLARLMESVVVLLYTLSAWMVVDMVTR